MKNNIIVNHDISEFSDLDYNAATVNEHYLNKFVAAGHDKNRMTLFNYFEPSPMPEVVNEIKQYFMFLENVTAAINLITPGNYLPYHSDLYERWMQIFNIPPEKIDRIYRYIVMLEDSLPGQIIQIGDESHSKWQAGDFFSWSGATGHAAYNFSLGNRYSVQITGILPDIYK